MDQRALQGGNGQDDQAAGALAGVAVGKQLFSVMIVMRAAWTLRPASETLRSSEASSSRTVVMGHPSRNPGCLVQPAISFACAFPMGTFLLLTCDVRIGISGTYRMGLNEVAIGIAPPGFAIELACSRVHPAWLSRPVTMEEMFEPQAALAAGFIDWIVDEASLEASIEAVTSDLAKLHMPSHLVAKTRLRRGAVETMRVAIDVELTLEAYRARPASPGVVPAPT